MTEPFTAVGIGDMSGDVFGNGMLYTDRIRLVAAFDHRHVFLDPQPDPAMLVRRAEAPVRNAGILVGRLRRERALRGGEVIDRTAKWVTLSAQAREALAIPDDTSAEMTPADVIRWVLQAPVDLLWNGGIGTYVKAANEGYTEVGDRANDPVRIGGTGPSPRRGGAGPRLHAARADRVRAHRWTDQHGLHRQLRRRRPRTVR